MSDIRIFATTKQLVIFLQTSVDTHEVILRKVGDGRRVAIISGSENDGTIILESQVMALFGEAIVGKWLRGEV